MRPILALWLSTHNNTTQKSSLIRVRSLLLTELLTAFHSLTAHVMMMIMNIYDLYNLCIWIWSECIEINDLKWKLHWVLSILCVFSQRTPYVSAILHGGPSSSSSSLSSCWCACGEIRCHHFIQKAFLLPAGRTAAFVSTAFHVTTHHLLLTFLYILSKTSVPPLLPHALPPHLSPLLPTSFSLPFLPPLISPQSPYPFSSSAITYSFSLSLDSSLIIANSVPLWFFFTLRGYKLY